MWIQSIDISGLMDLPQCTLDDIPQQGLRFRQATPETTALADAIELWFAAFQEDAIVDWVVGMGWAYEEEVEVFGEHQVEEVLWVDDTLPRVWVEDRDVSIYLKLGLDMQTIQSLRQFIVSPEILVSVMEEKSFSATVTLRFSNDYRVMAVGIQGMQLGSVRIPTERPVWIYKLFEHLSGRFVRDSERVSIAEAALQALLSMDGFERYQAFQDACALLGPVRVVGGRDRTPLLLVDGLPLRRWGTKITTQVRTLAASYLLPSTIVWSDELQNNPPQDKQVWGIDPASDRDGTTLNALLMSAPLTFKP